MEGHLSSDWVLSEYLKEFRKGVGWESWKNLEGSWKETCTGCEAWVTFKEVFTRGGPVPGSWAQLE